MSQPDEKLWSRDFVFILLYKALTSTIFIELTALLATYCFVTYDASASMAGVVVGMFIVGALIARLWLAKYTDIVGRKRLLVVGAAGYTLLMLLYLVPMNIVAFIVLRLVHGMMFGVVANTSIVAATGMAPVSRYGEAFSYLGICAGIGTAIGPPVGLAIEAAYGYQAAFIECALMSAASLLIGLAMNVPEFAKPRNRDEQHGAFRLSDYIDIPSLPMSVAVALIAFGIAATGTFVDPYSRSINLASAAGFYFVAYSVFSIVTRPYFGRLLDRRSDNLVMYPSLACYVAGFACLIWWHAAEGFIVAGALIGIANSNLNAVTSTVIAREAGSRMSEAMSTCYTFMDTGTGVGPSILGFVVVVSNYEGMFAVTAGILIVAGVIYHFIHGNSGGKIDRKRAISSTNVE